MKRINRAIALLLACCLVVGTLTACGGGSSTEIQSSVPSDSVTAENPIKILFSVGSKPNRVSNEDMKWFCDEVESRSEGRIVMEFHEGGELYSTEDSPGALLTGAIDLMCDGTTNLWPDYCPVFNLTECMFLMTDREVTYEHLDEIRDILFPIWENDIGVKPLAFMDRGNGGILTKKEINTPADLVGLQMRGTGTNDWLAMETLGMIPVQMSTNDQYDALAKGTLDGSRATYQNFAVNELGKYCKYLYCDVSYTLFALIMNMDVWNSLPADLQEIIQEVATEFEEKSFIDVAEEEEGYIEAMEALDVNMHHPTDDEISMFRAALQPFYDSVLAECEEKGYGEAAQQLYNVFVK